MNKQSKLARIFRRVFQSGPKAIANVGTFASASLEQFSGLVGIHFMNLMNSCLMRNAYNTWRRFTDEISK